MSFTNNIEHKKAVSWLLRIGLSFVFLYAAYSGFVSPSLWIGYIPDLPVDIDRAVLLQVWGVLEAALAIWLLSGWRVYLPALGLAVATVALMLVNPSQFSVLFRDAVIVFASMALAVLHYPATSSESS